MTHLLLEHLAWYAFTSGACGSIGLRKVGRGVNAHVMEACMTPLLARPLQDLRHYKDPPQMYSHTLVLKLILMEIY